MEDDSNYTNYYLNQLVANYNVPRRDICRYLQQINPNVGLVGVHRRRSGSPLFLVIESTEENIDAIRSEIQGFREGKRITAKYYETMDDLMHLRNPYRRRDIHIDFVSFMRMYVYSRRLFCSEFLLNV